MGEGLFRDEATEHHRSGEVRGGLLQIARPWVVGVYLGLLALFLLALGVAAFGRVRIYSEGRGVVRPREKVLQLRAPVSGFVKAVHCREGDRLDGEELVVTFDDMELRTDVDLNDASDALLYLQRRRLEVRAPAPGVLDELVVREGDWVGEGGVLGKIVPAQSHLVGYLWLPERDWPYLEVGGRVRLKFDGYPYEEMGVGWGRIVRVSEDLTVDGTAAADGRGPPSGSVLVEVEVERLPPRAVEPRLRNGMLYTGEVILRVQRISVLLLKPLADLLAE